jgi:hypothetical protein
VKLQAQEWQRSGRMFSLNMVTAMFISLAAFQTSTEPVEAMKLIYEAARLSYRAYQRFANVAGLDRLVSSIKALRVSAKTIQRPSYQPLTSSIHCHTSSFTPAHTFGRRFAKSQRRRRTLGTKQQVTSRTRHVVSRKCRTDASGSSFSLHSRRGTTLSTPVYNCPYPPTSPYRALNAQELKGKV